MSLSVQPIIARIKAARVKKGLSQRALSAKTGIPQSHLCRIERGEVDPQISTIVEIARVLELEFTFVPGTLLNVLVALERADEISRTGDAPIPMYRLEKDEEDEDDEANYPPFKVRF